MHGSRVPRRKGCVTADVDPDAPLAAHRKLLAEADHGEAAGESVVPGGPHGDPGSQGAKPEGPGCLLLLAAATGGLVVEVRVQLPPPAHALTVNHEGQIPGSPCLW